MSDPDANPAFPSTPDGYSRALGLELVSAGPDEVIVRMPVDARHRQPMGIVHGGVYCSLVETACSIGANQAAMAQGRLAVGLDNQTSFLRAVREGTLRTTARPLSASRRTALWQALITDDDDRLVARGQLRLLCIDQGAQLAGQGAAFRPPEE